MLRSLFVSFAALTVTSLAGCASAPEKSMSARAVLTAASDVNPNSEGRPSPVRVRILQLKEEGAFLDADFWSLVEREQQTLGDSLLQRFESTLVPGERKQLELEIHPEARVLAVMAEYANFRDATWRAVVKTPDKSLLNLIIKERVTIDIQKDRVLLAPGG